MVFHIAILQRFKYHNLLSAESLVAAHCGEVTYPDIFQCTALYLPAFRMSLIKNKDKKEKLAHILAGVIILVHAYEKFELGESSYIAFLFAGIIFLAVALLHHRLAKRFPYIDGVFFIIESIVYAIIAADYFHLGKKALPWCYVFVAVAYVFVAYKKAKQGALKHKKLSS